MTTRTQLKPGVKQSAAEKMSRLPVRFAATTPAERLRKPDWIRAKFPGGAEVERLKRILRQQQLHTVCEEASCPNLGECFGNGTATFMILGDICTRRCPFCDVAHGRPEAVDTKEPENLAVTIAQMGLRFVVITSVDRDDLRDGGAAHFVACIDAVRKHSSTIQIEILTPDFRGRVAKAVKLLTAEPPDVFNHNLETVPRLYRRVRPGADYQYSLDLLKAYKSIRPDVVTKSGLMLGLGEEIDEVKQVLQDLKAHDVDMITLGQYLQPSKDHLKVERFVHPSEFDMLSEYAEGLGFSQVASGPLVRSSYPVSYTHLTLPTSDLV